MVDLRPTSPLQQLMASYSSGAVADAPGVSLSERAGLSLAQIMVRNAKTPDLQQRLRERLGLTLPSTGHCSIRGSIELVWVGPGRWLAMTTSEDAAAFEAGLRSELDGLASVTNQSDGRCIMRIAGPKARDTLAKALPIDLHPRVFQTGDTALTVAAHINLHIWQVDDAPTYDLAVFRSYAASFCEFITSAALEFGIRFRR